MREVSETFKCDASGCRKQPGGANEHVQLVVTYHAKAGDVPEGVQVGPVEHLVSLDFCSWEHAKSGLASFAKDAESHRDEVLDGARAQAEERAAFEAEQERVRQEQAKIAAEAEKVEAAEAA